MPENLRDKRVFRLSLDALAKDAKTSSEFESRAQAVFAEVEKANGQIILFVDQLHEYAGSRASSAVSATVQAAIEANHVRLVGGASREAYTEYVASDANLAKLFQPISIDPAGESTTSSMRDSNRGSGEGFEGDKVSPDLREMIKASSNDRVKVILQAKNIRSDKLRSLLRRHNVEITEQFQQLGTLAVELPLKAVEELATSNLTSYISLDRDVRTLQLLSGLLGLGDGGSVGHVENTTGAVCDAQAIREQRD